jgi:hypothetical protein
MFKTLEIVRMVIEFKVIMFKFLHVWITAYDSSCFSSFLEFMDFCFS